MSPAYFEEEDPFADFVVHEVAHIFHNGKRRKAGLRETRRREWSLDIEFRKRETFAYACEAYACVLRHARKRAERGALAAECLRAEQNGELETAAEGLGLLIDLMREIDQCRDDILFFADEAGSWQVGVLWDRVLPALFWSLSPTTEAYEWAETVFDALNNYISARVDSTLSLPRAGRCHINLPPCVSLRGREAVVCQRTCRSPSAASSRESRRRMSTEVARLLAALSLAGCSTISPAWS